LHRLVAIARIVLIVLANCRNFQISLTPRLASFLSFRSNHRLERANMAGRKSRSEREKEVASEEARKREVLGKMTEALRAIALKHEILPEKLYTCRELADKLGISTVKFWRDGTNRRSTLRRQKFGKYFRVLGYDYLRFLARTEDPIERDRIARQEALKSARQERLSWPLISPPEYKIARECRIRPSVAYELYLASELTGFSVAAIGKWAARLGLLDRYGQRMAFVFGRDLLFFVYERRWSDDVKKRRKNGESIARYLPETPRRYQSDGYKNSLRQMENRQYRERFRQRQAIADQAAAIAKAEEERRREERKKELERQEALRTERSFSPEPLTKERYTIKEVAVLARRERKTVERWIKMGWVKTIKIGRNVFIEREEVVRIQETNGKPWLSPREN
jgi:hypothetical protein